MGISAATQLEAFLRKIAPGAYVDVVAPSEKDAFLKKKAKNAELFNVVSRQNISARAVALDLMSHIMTLMAYAKSTLDVTTRLEKIITGCFHNHGARIVVVCIDDRDLVPRAKEIERARRSSSKREPPYEHLVNLADGTVCRLDEFDFAYDCPMPDNYQRMMRTPILMSKFLRFLAHFLYQTLCPYADLHVVICGAEVFDENAKEWSHKTLHAKHYASKETIRYERDRVLVGEGEGKCVYWVLKMLREIPNLSSVLVKCNDSDALVSLLLNVPRMADTSASLWLDFTAPASHTRYVDVCLLWRSIHEWTRDVLPPGRFQHAPIECLLFAAICGGCDYTQKLPGTGPNSFLSMYLSDPGMLASSVKGSVGAISLPPEFDVRPCMSVCEDMFLQLTWSALCNKPAFRKAVGSLQKQVPPFRERFKHAMRFCEKYNDATKKTREEIERANELIAIGGGKKRKKSLPTLIDENIPPFDGILAFLRRVTWALDYYRNIWLPATDSLAKIDNLSLYGFELDPEGRVREADTVAPAKEPFISRVVIHPKIQQQRDAERMRRAREEEESQTDNVGRTLTWHEEKWDEIERVMSQKTVPNRSV